MKFEGEIQEIDLLAKLVELGRERFTGALRFEHDAIIKIIYLKVGDILSASTNDRADSIDEILLRSGKASREHIKQALAKRKDTESLGESLLALGFISKKELSWARRIQLVGIIRSLIRWEAGSYQLVADYLPKREEGLTFYLPQIVLEILVTEEDRTPVDSQLRGGEIVLAKSENFDQAYKLLGLNEEADRILSAVEGTRSAAEIAGATPSESFAVYKLLSAMLKLGLLTDQNAQVTHEGSGLEFETESDYDFESHSMEVTVPVVVAGSDETLSFDPQRSEAASDSLPNDPQAWESPAQYASGSLPNENSASDFRGIEQPPQLAPAAASADFAPPAPVTGVSRGATRAPQFTPPKKKRGANRMVLALLALIVLGGLGYGGYVYLEGRNAPEPSPMPPAIARRKPVTTSTAPTSSLPDESEIPSVTVAGDPASTSASPVPTPASQPSRSTVAPPGAAPPRTEIDRTALEHRSAASAVRYSVQFELVCEAASISRATRAGGQNVWFLPITYRGRNCYRVFWGRYADRTSAERGTTEIPPSLRGSKPVVVDIQKVLEP